MEGEKDDPRPIPENRGQLITEDGEFNPEIVPVLSRWGFATEGFDYVSLSILGAQSSGKSTLLNNLFKTNFEVMNAEMGRSQTTKGVWLGLSGVEGQSVIVMDVEGTDGRERGEEQQTFERQSSLLSLALAEILLINLWMHDIGRYNAANYGLLKTVFELNLKLFLKDTSTKTLLLFVIRDYNKKTPLDTLKNTIIVDLNKIWEDLYKPSPLEDSKLTDFFDLEFSPLSSYELAEGAFLSEVAELRTRFVDPDSEGYLGKSEYNKKVPADGWAHYAEQIWKVIKSSKDLDLPTQKQALAMFRCEEIMDEARNGFDKGNQPLHLHLRKTGTEFIPEYGSKIQNLVDVCLSEFDEPTRWYEQTVVQAKRSQLVTSLHTELYSDFLAQLGKISTASVAFFDQKAKEAIPDDIRKSITNFSGFSENVEQATLDFYRKHAEDSLLPEAEWSYDSELEIFQSTLKDLIEKVKQEQLERLMKSAQEKFKTKTMVPINKLIEAASEDMWEHIREIWDDARHKGLEKLITHLTAFGVTEEETEQRREEMEALMMESLFEKMREKKDKLSYKMEKRFDSKFNFKDGLPKRWQITDNVGDHFKEATAEALKVLNLYALVRLDESLDSVNTLDSSDYELDHPESVVVDTEERDNIKETFERQARQYFYSAIKQQEDLKNSGSLPLPLLILVAVLGFNEFIWVISNPILLVLFILVGAIAMAVWYAGMGPQALQFGSFMWTQAVSQGTQALQGAMAGQDKQKED